MAFSGFSGGAYRAAGDVNHAGFADGITEVGPRRAKVAVGPTTYGPDGFADLIAGSTPAPIRATAFDRFARARDASVPVPQDAGGIFVG